MRTILNLGRMFFCCLLAASPLFAQGGSDGADKATRLRLVGSPKGTFSQTNQGARWIRYIETEVRNVGEVDATNVSVVAVLPDGQKVPLEGPATIARNQTGLFIKDIRMLVNSNGALTATISCGNCRK